MMTLSKFTPTNQAWKGAAFGVFIATLLLMILSTINLLQNNVSWGDAALFFAIGSLVSAILGAFLVFIYILVAKISPLAKWAIACFSLVVYYFFFPTQTSIGLFLIGIWTVLSFSVTFGSLWSILTNRSENKKYLSITFACFLLGIFFIGLLIYWLNAASKLFSPQFKEGEKKVTTLALADPALQGPYSIVTYSYGRGDDKRRPEYGEKANILTKVVDGHPYIRGWSGISGWMRTRYWGFDSNHLPLNGLVWQPEGTGPFPLVMIVHGNHEMTAHSDRGYDYLGNLLASRGFIVVSIDQNFLNGAWIDFGEGLNEVAARGWLILEHLNLWRDWNNSKESSFFNLIDMEKIALIGHSRGGEAIATASVFNNLSHFPGNGNILFDYHFNILGLVAIAPVDAQYSPGGQKSTLNNIDYLVIQGAHDGDVRSFQGAGQYSRVHFDNSDYHFKTALYVYGANHGQFNTIWGKRDIQSPASIFFDLNQFLPQEEQQQIAKVYISAFLETVLHDEKGYMPLFHTWHAGKKWLPQTLYFNQFADSKEISITNDERSIDLGKATFPGSIVKGKNLKSWHQKLVATREGNSLHTGIYLGWNNISQQDSPATYSIFIPKNGISINNDSILILSLADSNHNEEEKNENYLDKDPIDFSIELIDSKGNIASLPLSHEGYLHPTIHTHLMTSDLLDPLVNNESIFQTFEFYLKDFVQANPIFDPRLLESISLVFNRTDSGLIILNSISVRN
jgi:hypothetical protein